MFLMMSLVKTCENDNRIARPTPLYFMDEIDAALDFRNVSIIANYIKAICWTSRPSVLSCTSCRCSVWMPLKSTWCPVHEPSSHEDHWIQSKFIDSTTWIQYSRLYSDIGQNKLLLLCSNELHHRSRVDLLHVTNTTNTILPTEWWTSPKMNIGWQQVFTIEHPNVSKERTKNAQFIVISLRNHMPLGVSNWRFPAGKLFAQSHLFNLDTLSRWRRHANNSGHTCFVPSQIQRREGDDWIYSLVGSQ